MAEAAKVDPGGKCAVTAAYSGHAWLPPSGLWAVWNDSHHTGYAFSIYDAKSIGTELSHRNQYWRFWVAYTRRASSRPKMYILVSDFTYVYKSRAPMP